MNRVLLVLHPHSPRLGLDGWRWAVHVGTTPARQQPLQNVVNAGWAESRKDADLEGQLVAYSVVNFAGILGLRFSLEPVTFDEDILS